MSEAKSNPVHWYIQWILVALLVACQALWRLVWPKSRNTCPCSEFNVRRVCVVGAGASGLITAKTLIEEREKGNEDWHIDLFEASDTVAGLWNYSEHENTTACYASLTTNLSSSAMSLSDFPLSGVPNKEIPHEDVRAFLASYAKHFEIRKKANVHFNHRVLAVRQRSKQCWEVTVFDEASGKQRKEVYEAVVVCNGHYSRPFVPDIDGINTFDGEISHSMQYSSPDQYEGQRVLIVGCGPSGGEIAADVASTAKEVTISSRRGFIPLPKVNPSTKQPMDYALTRLASLLPTKVKDLFFQLILRKFVNAMQDIDVPVPDISVERDAITITITSHLWRRLKEKRATVKVGGIRCCRGNTVEFEDGTSQSFDHIIFCTGYSYNYPFLSDLPLQSDEYQFVDPKLPLIDRSLIPMHDHVFFIDDPSLAFVGIPTAAFIFPMCEIQARWLAKVFSNNIPLVSPSAMRSKFNDAIQHYMQSPKPFTRVDPILYCNDVAEQASLMPPLRAQIFLLPEIYLGPPCAAFYRLGDVDPAVSMQAAEQLRRDYEKKFA